MNTAGLIQKKKKLKVNKIRITGADRIYLAVVYTLLGLFVLSIIYPLVYVISASFSSPRALMTGRVFLLPVEPGLQGYTAVFSNPNILRSYLNTILYTSVGTAISVIVTLMGGFVLSRREYPFKMPVMIFFTITMFFSGGLIPTYLLINQLGLINTIWALVLPGAFSVWYGVIVRTFIQSTIPEELFEATSLDGGDYFDYLFKVIVPLSTPVLAVMALSFATGHWNSYFSAMIYLNDMDKYPLQIILRSILIENSVTMTRTSMVNITDLMEKQYLAELLKYSLIIVSSVPLLVLYPFLQRFFIKGIMVGSLKG
jgi:multiple sugar transport system permease protein/putative aldouronate transport system permease protein